VIFISITAVLPRLFPLSSSPCSSLVLTNEQWWRTLWQAMASYITNILFNANQILRLLNCLQRSPWTVFTSSQPGHLHAVPRRRRRRPLVNDELVRVRLTSWWIADRFSDRRCRHEAARPREEGLPQWPAVYTPSCEIRNACKDCRQRQPVADQQRLFIRRFVPRLHQFHRHYCLPAATFPVHFDSSTQNHRRLNLCSWSNTNLNVFFIYICIFSSGYTC